MFLLYASCLYLISPLSLYSRYLPFLFPSCDFWICLLVSLTFTDLCNSISWLSPSFSIFELDRTAGDLDRKWGERLGNRHAAQGSEWETNPLVPVNNLSIRFSILIVKLVNFKLCLRCLHQRPFLHRVLGHNIGIVRTDNKKLSVYIVHTNSQKEEFLPVPH